MSKKKKKKELKFSIVDHLYPASGDHLFVKFNLYHEIINSSIFYLKLRESFFYYILLLL
jgi:hypothetical protein